MDLNAKNIAAVSTATLGLLVAIEAQPSQTADELYESTEELFNENEVNARQIVQSLKRARDRGWVNAEGAGRRGDPHRFYLTELGKSVTIILLERFMRFGAQLNALRGGEVIKNMTEDGIKGLPNRKVSKASSQKQSCARSNPAAELRVGG